MDDLKPKVKKPRADGQMTGLAGELFVAAELLKRGLQVSLTFGNAKAIDLFAHNPETNRDFTIQVKALRSKNYFLISHGKVFPKHVYVFVLLNKPGTAVQYFIVPGLTLVNEPERFSKYFVDLGMPGIHSDTLQKAGFADAWQVFQEPAN